MKVRTYGALMGALLTISAVDTAEAATCACDTPPRHATATRHAPARIVRHAGADAEYAQSFYDYRSASRVSEVFVRTDAPPMAAMDDGFRVAPNDATIRFYRDERVIYVPVAASAPPYPPPPAYYPPAYYPAPLPGIQLDERALDGGVGYGGVPGGGGGGGYGGFLYTGQTGGQDEPANGGGVSLPPGYGPTYRGVWNGQGTPTQGGGAGIAGSTSK